MQNTEKPIVDGGLRETFTPKDLPENASTMDVKTIKNAIKKRLPGVDEACMVVIPFRDAIGIGVAVEIGGKMTGFSEPAKIGFNHKDLLNVIDRLDQAIKNAQAVFNLGRSGIVFAKDHR